MSRRHLSSTAAIAVLTTIFFTWGALTSLNDVLIPHLKAVFEMNYAQTMLIQFTFFSTYLLMSIPAGKVVSQYGYKRSIVIGLVVAGIGALLFFPAAKIPSYPLFLFALYVLASGITLLQVSANPYIALLGDPQTASSRLTLAQALNSFGHTIAPALIGPLILSVAVIGSTELAAMPETQQAAYRVAQAESVQLPYLGLAVGLFLLAAFVLLFRLPALTEATEQADHRNHTFGEALRHRHLRLGVIAIFLYVGAEVAIGSFLINYIADARIGAMDEASAARYVSYYWGAAMVGRFIGSALLKKIEPRVLLGLFAIAAIALLGTTMLNDGPVAMWAVIAVGLFNSIMFPTIFTLGIEGLGPLTSKASSLLVMAIVGGAVVPLLQGVLADRIGVQPAFVLPLLCYVYISWYGFRGARRALVVGAPAPVAQP
ncbi:L-fucose:H+ symporter permease [Lysobacter panacisoli]|uniref:L-fucose:H+ symporter permease n=1 Tax=Lysobacter panacisoli TaxID=1255263 RepID=A0ABP9L4W4_9GAMM|nr:L-fucose:H+ symporter permease [Lysobacter panacisoli]